MNEIWKDIEFTDNKYAVSNLGNVKRNEHYTTIGPTKNRKESSTIFYKERLVTKYDSVRVNNPDATYFDIKEQFDSIPTYEDGKGKTINKADLPPEYRIGTPEYFERQRKISGAINAVQPEAYITPAGYIKDAVNFIEDLGKGNYTGAAIDAALNLIPLGLPAFFGEEQENK